MGRRLAWLLRRLVRELWPPLLLLGLWQVWVATAGYSSIVLVSPVAVFSDLVRFPGAYLAPLVQTAMFALGGLLLGMLAGVVLAVAVSMSELLDGLLTPFALLLTSTPVVCLIPILARLFGHKSRTELVTVAILTFFPAFIYGTAGLRDLPPMSPEVFAVLSSTRWQRLWQLAMPAAVPSLAVALRVGATYSVLVALLAEYLMQTGGLGTLFAITMQQFHLARALGASVLAMALSVLLYEAGRSLERRVDQRYRTGGILGSSVSPPSSTSAPASLRR